jgi:hypothetical protein
MLADAENYRAIRITDIPFGALDVVRTGSFPQLVAVIKRPVLGPAVLGTPATVRDAVVYGPIQSRTISTGLAT